VSTITSIKKLKFDKSVSAFVKTQHSNIEANPVETTCNQDAKQTLKLSNFGAKCKRTQISFKIKK